MGSVTLPELHLLASAAIAELPEGDALSEMDLALVRLGLAASVTSLDEGAIAAAMEDAIGSGASAQQIQEVVSLISALGVHSLMVTAALIVRATGLTAVPLSAEQQALWDKHVGNDPFWKDFDAELPGFLVAMLRLSTDQFSAFFDYCAIPWRSGQVRAKLKELIAMASDATPAHRFLPGFRIHLQNAIKLGAGRRAIGQALDLASAAPTHQGWR